MEQTWRWFGPHDNVTLTDARQAGATGIVNALHEIPPGEVWPVDAIRARQKIVADAGLTWSVVESVNISEAIKKGSAERTRHIDNYRQTLKNLAACGIRTVCYNFMPVLDWLRTDLAYPLPDGALAMRFDALSLAAFDLFLLKRPGAEADWTEEQQREAHTLLNELSESQKATLLRIVLAGLPGTTETYTLDYVRDAIAGYGDLGRDGLRENLGSFLRAVCPLAEELGIRLCIHPDDPPRPLLGLPRICSTGEDLDFLLAQSPEPANGITFCSGSLGARLDNDLPAILKRVAHRVWFVHLRATKQELPRDAFYEAPHLAGDVDMVALFRILVREERRRQADGDTTPIPFRSDHGNQILTDIGRPAVPGYPAVGRLKGLAELRGILTAVESLT
jgi:mannonate dehydratase